MAAGPYEEQERLRANAMFGAEGGKGAAGDAKAERREDFDVASGRAWGGGKGVWGMEGVLWREGETADKDFDGTSR